MRRQARLPRPFGRFVALRRPPLCNEIVLWLLSDEVDLEAECAALHDAESPPYWAFCWGSGQALARWLLDHPATLRGRRVVDFGSGSGVVAIAAALAGAERVTAVDVDPAAREAIRANAAANGLEPTAIAVGQSLPETWDLLLASDVLYEPGLREVMADLQAEASRRGADMLVGEPERPGSCGHAAAVLERYAVQAFPDVDSPTAAASVYRLV